MLYSLIMKENIHIDNFNYSPKIENWYYYSLSFISYKLGAP